MSLDVVDLRSFYATPLGRVAQRIVNAIVRARWDHCTGLSMLGIGYATPYLDAYRGDAVRVLAFMPAEQGVVNWPESGPSASALVDVTTMPLPDACMDRVLLVHALELSEAPRDLLSEIWRILTPGGRMLIIAPNRRGVWARVETTPFGQGQPYSRGQLRDLLRQTQFSPVHESEALYMPPFARSLFLRTAAAFERIGVRFALPGGGVHVIEATKQVYRPVAIRKAVRRRLPQLEPALAPTPAGIGFDGQIKA
jgi:SAM-dependent methyltransferase